MTTQGHTYHDDVIDLKEDVNGTQVNNTTTNQTNGHNHKTERYWWKRFGREFLSFDIMFDALFLNSKRDDQLCMRVPLVTLVDYKGFRALCIAHIQIDNSV